uniref:BHLH domain-containing protein n=1 Tax=Musa acuminata subsp. malaccensis TaxID=214687 RepID=A0A804I0G2_MUSAM
MAGGSSGSSSVGAKRESIADPGCGFGSPPLGLSDWVADGGDDDVAREGHLLWSPVLISFVHVHQPGLIEVSSLLSSSSSSSSSYIMDKEANNPAGFATTAAPQESSENSIEMVNYMLSNPAPQTQISLDKLSFADVMQFAELGPKLALHQSRASEEENYFLKFQLLGDKLHDDALMASASPSHLLENKAGMVAEEDGEKKARSSENASSVQHLHLVGETEKAAAGVVEAKNRRKRPRALKTSEEVESQRMTHIAVERNRRRQMNEHLRVLRSLMPGSYVQRGDQASIIGGAIEFVRELEQLLQCLESQKRRRLFGGGEAPRPAMDAPPLPNQQPFYPPLPFPNADQVKILDIDPSGGGLREETAENKSCLADVEVRLLGFDAMIKILSRRRPGQLIKTIAALEDLQFAILHTNITTIEQTVLYSFNVKIASETRCTAEDIANSVQQILSFIDANTV